MAEFATNANVSNTTKVSPFFANSGFEPRMEIYPKPPSKPPKSGQAIQREIAVQWASQIKEIWELVQEETRLSQVRMAAAANRRRSIAPAYRVRDWVFLKGKNIRTRRPSKKLEARNLGPYQIIEKVSKSAYKLDIEGTMYEKIHNVFHTSLLSLYEGNSLPGQELEHAFPTLIEDEVEGGDDGEHEVEAIEDSKWNEGGSLSYKVQWYHEPPDDEWYHEGNFDKAIEEVNAFHQRFPTRPGGEKDPSIIRALEDNGEKKTKAKQKCK